MKILPFGRIRLSRELWVLGFFIVVTAVMTWPAVVHPTSVIIGEGGDPWQTLWRFEYSYERLIGVITSPEPAGVRGALEFFQREFLGGGEPRLVNLSVWPWMPLYALLGNPQTYNVVWLLSFFFSGYSAYLLVRWLLREYAPKDFSLEQQEWGASIAGLYYLLLPYHVAHSLGHFGAMQLQWLPLLVLALLVWLKRPTIWRTLALAVLFTIQVWVEHHYALWFVVIAAMLLWWQRHYIFSFRNHHSPLPTLSQSASWRRERGTTTGAHLHQLLLLLVLLLGITLPSISPTIRLATGGSSLALGVEQSTRFSADLFAYITPASFHSVWGNMVQLMFGHRFTGNISESTQYLGLIPLLLLFFFHQRIPRQQKIVWVSLASLFLIISLGPRLHVLGVVTPLPLPVALVDSWPIISSVRAMGRAGAVVGLCIAILLGWVVTTQVKRVQFVYLIVGLIMAEFLFFPTPLIPAILSPAYTAVRDFSGSRLIELPAATNYAAASRSLYASLTHGKQVVGSIALERATDGSDLIEARSLPALRQLLYLRTTHVREDRPDFFAQEPIETISDTVRWLDAGVILIHTDSLSALQLAATRSFLETDLALVPITFSDALLYDLAPLQQSTTGDGVFMSRDNRWAQVGYDAKRGHTFAELPTTALTTLFNVTQQPLSVRLQWQVPPEGHGSISIRDATSGIVVGDSEAGAGDTAEIVFQVPPGKIILEWRNRLPQPVILQDPVMSVVK